MRFHPFIIGDLTAMEVDALSNAVDAVADFLLSEWLERREVTGSDVGTVFTDCFLPDRYRDLYDCATIRRLYICLVVVAAKFQDGWSDHACRGEELVTAAVIEQAKLIYQYSGGTASGGFDDMYDTLYEDEDFRYMFDPAFDGIDDPETAEGAIFGTGPLHPSAWFAPFRDTQPTHPLLN